MTKNAKQRVSFTHLTVGAVVEFSIAHQPAFIGTIRALSTNGPGAILAHFSKVTTLEGEELPLIKPVINAEVVSNVDHAVRILKPGSGKLEFDHQESHTSRALALREATRYRAQGQVSRRGRYVVAQTVRETAPTIIKQLILAEVFRENGSLKIEPWEVLQTSELVNDVFAKGIARTSYEVLPGGLPGRRVARRGLVRNEEEEHVLRIPKEAKLDMPRLRKYLRQNLNRFKLSISVAAQEHADALDAIYAKEDERDY